MSEPNDLHRTDPAAYERAKLARYLRERIASINADAATIRRLGDHEGAERWAERAAECERLLLPVAPALTESEQAHLAADRITDAMTEIRARFAGCDWSDPTHAATLIRAHLRGSNV